MSCFTVTYVCLMQQMVIIRLAKSCENYIKVISLDVHLQKCPTTGNPLP